MKLRDASEMETSLPVMKAPHLASDFVSRDNTENETRAVSVVFKYSIFTDNGYEPLPFSSLNVTQVFFAMW